MIYTDAMCHLPVEDGAEGTRRGPGVHGSLPNDHHLFVIVTIKSQALSSAARQIKRPDAEIPARRVHSREKGGGQVA